jgi:hypothetical protein
MPTFVYAFDDGLKYSPDNEEFNLKLESLQQKGAKILDIKVSISSGYELRDTYIDPIRTYLVIYEAEKPLL